MSRISEQTGSLLRIGKGFEQLVRYQMSHPGFSFDIKILLDQINCLLCGLVPHPQNRIV